MAGRNWECCQYPSFSAPPPPPRFCPRRSSRREWEKFRPLRFASEPRDGVPPSMEEKSAQDPEYIRRYPRKSRYGPVSTRPVYPPSYDKYQTAPDLAHPPSHHRPSVHPSSSSYSQRPRHVLWSSNASTSSSSRAQSARVVEPVTRHVSHSGPSPTDTHHPNLCVTVPGGDFQPRKQTGGKRSLVQSPPITTQDFQPMHAPPRRNIKDYTDLSPNLSRKTDTYRNADTVTSYSTKPIPVSKSGKKIVALDCEMVGCLEINLPRVQGAGTSADLLRGTLNKVEMKRKRKKKRKPLLREASVAGRCSIVDYNGRVLYDKYIKPNEQILSLRTRWSGITSSHMQSAIPFDEAQAEILDLLDDCVIVGHSIVNDTDSLKIEFPPQERVRDTSCYVPLRTMAGMDRAKVPSLKRLANALLGLEIQKGAHSSVEDARVSMKLYKLVEQEWEGKG